MQSRTGGQKPTGTAGGELTGGHAGDQAGAGSGENREDEAGRKRLLALLRELVARSGKVKAAKELGVSFRTLQQAAGTGELTPRMEDALKGWLLADGVRAGRRLHELERRQERHEAALTALAKELGAQLADLSRALRELREAAPVAERPDATASEAERPDHTAGSGKEREGTASNSARRPPPAPVRGVAESVVGRRPVTKPRRAHPDLVTLEAEEGEELVYGEKATPLIAEWREARAAFIDRGNSRVERATAWVRMCERALTLIGEYELTLPLADYPWDRFERRRELRRSEESLRDARRELRRALVWRFLRRALTLGRWRR